MNYVRDRFVFKENTLVVLEYDEILVGNEKQNRCDEYTENATFFTER